jgi:pimeloyl-ACP methyl ester carboxylesterase
MAQDMALADQPAKLLPCRVEGIPNELLCSSVRRPLDPARPEGVQIEVHFLVVPAMARNKQPDPVLLLAGGPGQSAMALAPAVMGQFARLNNRRDVVFIDQRGTGKSAPLQCPDEKDLPLAQALDPQQQQLRIAQCREALGKLPHGDLRFYTTTLAMQDFDAVRQALGAPRWNLVGASYGTRAALEYLRQFPDKVRRTVLDGVAPPDMVLPASFSIDTQTALDAALTACEQENACKHQYPRLRQEWAELLKSLPRTVSVDHPVTGLPETFMLTRDMVLRSVRAPLYSPAIASALPAAIHSAVQGRYAGLVGMSGALGTSKSSRLAMGMHFSVVCAEDMPRLASRTGVAGVDFGNMDAELYAKVCAQWPHGEVPAAFYAVPSVLSPVLLLSGGADPATPPRHGEQVQRALGAMAQHIVVSQAGHGVMPIGCMRELVSRFIDTQEDAKALPLDAICVTGIPRPGAFIPAGVSP